MPRRSSAKKPILDRLWAMVKARGPPWTFNNEDDVKAAIAAHKTETGVGWRNYADIPKIDFRDDLSDSMKADDMFIVHLGGGRHEFLKGVDLTFRRFEPISPLDVHVKTYSPTPLDALEEKNEAGDLSRILNLRVFHEFLYQQPGKEIRIRLPGRKQNKSPMDYDIGPHHIRTQNLQIELDFIAETEIHDAPLDISIAEAKSVLAPDFNASQVFVPFRFMRERTLAAGYKVNIHSLFLQSFSRRFKKGDPLGVRPGWHTVSRLHEFQFPRENDLASITQVKSAEYILVAVPRGNAAVPETPIAHQTGLPRQG